MEVRVSVTVIGVDVYTHSGLGAAAGFGAGVGAGTGAGTAMAKPKTRAIARRMSAIFFLMMLGTLFDGIWQGGITMATIYAVFPDHLHDI